ncbi:hypothetical protein BHE74_00057141, partial [Ensete ventricosum]
LHLASLVLNYASTPPRSTPPPRTPPGPSAVAVRADVSDPSDLRCRRTSSSPEPASATPGSRFSPTRTWTPGTPSSASMPGSLASAARGRREDPDGAVVAGGGASAGVRGVHGFEGGGRGDDEHTGEGAAVDGDHGQLRRAGADRH